MTDYEKIAGNWYLVDYLFVTTEGENYYPWGQNFDGHISYSPDGNMAVQIMQSDRKHFTGPDVMNGLPEEAKEAFDGYIAYWGAYDLNSDEHYVVHHLKGCLFPNWIGTDFKRFYRFENDLLVLETAPLLFNARTCVATLKWRR
jgi:Lipocalin-like domain